MSGDDRRKSKLSFLDRLLQKRKPANNHAPVHQNSTRSQNTFSRLIPSPLTQPPIADNVRVNERSDQYNSSIASSPWAFNESRHINILNPSQAPEISEEDAIPSNIKCNLVIILDKGVPRSKQGPSLSWLDRDSYEQLIQARDDELRVISGLRQPPIKNVSLIDGDVTLFKNGQELNHGPLLHQGHWADTVPKMIARYCAENPYTPIHLEARWQFASAPDGVLNAGELKEWLRSSMSNTWENGSYLPRSQFDTLFSKEQIKAIVCADEPFCRSMNWIDNNGDVNTRQQEDFVDLIYDDGVRLLANCIWNDIPLNVLKMLLDGNLRNTSLPLRDEQCPEDVDKWLFERFIGFQDRFCVVDFFHKDGIPDDNFQEIQDHESVPMRFNESDDLIGQGAHGQVFKAQIHPDHHRFPLNRDKSFAVKRYMYEPRSRTVFQRERAALRILSDAPHPSIVTHFACWTYKQGFYMLFPLAATSLAEYFRTQPAQPMTKQYALWILEQMYALAAGVAHIHVLRKPRQLQLSSPVDTEERDFGYHHDLKPANILVYRENQAEVWKITDFGNAHIYKAVTDQSQRTKNLTMGDEVYGSPDWALNRETSRPYDVWSLGCIFLEVLIWQFWSAPGEGLEEFKEWRSRDHMQRHTPAFWYWNPENGEPALLPSVGKVLKELEQRTRGFFRDVVKITRMMLTLDPDDRPFASWVVYSMVAAKIQADAELSTLQDDELYLSDADSMRIAQSQPTAAPVTLPFSRARSNDAGSVASDVRRDVTSPTFRSLEAAAHIQPGAARQSLSGLGQQYSGTPTTLLPETLEERL